MGRSPCCSKVGLRRGPWSTKEDSLLTNFIQENGEGQWRSLPKKAGLLRCGKSCRLRWMNYLRPGILRGNITEDEEDLIVRLHGLLGNRWSLIAGRLPGRTDNEIKNYWNTHLFKKLKSSGKDLPKPHKPPSKTSKKKKAVVNEKVNVEEKEITKSDPPKIKVYLPKPIRVTRTNSYDSLVSSDGSEKAAEYFPVEWPAMEFGGVDELFVGGGLILPVLNDSSGDVNMWEKVYDEYLQLL